MTRTCVASLALWLLCAGAMAAPDAEDALLGPRMAPQLAPQAADPGVARAAPASAGAPVGSRLIRDLAYGDAPRQRMDIYLPPAPARAPVIFMVHGGAWRAGDKAARGVVDNKASHWLGLGYIFISVNYRLLPDVDPLVQADDLRRALAFAQEQASEWGGDPDAFVLMGHSAGAHLVSLINAAPQTALDMGARPWRGAVALDTAAMDVVALMKARHARLFDDAFGDDPSYWQAASPAHQLRPGAPPLLLVCSTLRPDHPCAGTRDFGALAARKGLRVQVLPQALTHEGVNEALGKPGDYTRQVDAFIRSLRPEGS